MKGEIPGSFTGVMIVQIKINESLSLKDRRQIVRSLVDKSRKRFNVSVADLGPDDSHQDAYLAFSLISSSITFVEERMDSIKRLISSLEDSGEFCIVRETREVERNAGFSY